MQYNSSKLYDAGFPDTYLVSIAGGFKVSIEAFGIGSFVEKSYVKRVTHTISRRIRTNSWLT